MVVTMGKTQEKAFKKTP